MNDPVFREEQEHLSEMYATLEAIGLRVANELERVRREAAADKRSMAEELAPDFATYSDAMETYADFAAMNRIIEGYNLAADANAQKLADVQLLLKQPYFAKVTLQMPHATESKDVYIGNAGMSDDNYKRLVVDWRSPVAEVYYNQDNGPTSYVANGRTIKCDLKLRRQFDIEGAMLRAYFDTTVAIQDSLLLASLSKQRTAHMKAITATIQREQNVVVRHADVPALLVGGIAGSGKTSVLMQRIAYLFYQNREQLDPRQVFLITPNEVFGRYVEHVLPDLGERNPEIMTWDEFARRLMPADRAHGNMNAPLEVLDRIDRAMARFEYDQADFRELRMDDVRFISTNQINQIAAKYRHIPDVVHRTTLMREEIYARVKARIAQLTGPEEAQLEIHALSLDEQLAFFGETFDPQDEREAKALTQRYLEHKYAGVYDMLEGDAWLRIDRIGARVLGVANLEPVTWLYLRIALTGLGNPEARYVMIDEVQDYTVAQLAVMARYFKRAHFMLLGDENQAIKPNTACFAEIRDLFTRLRGGVEECSLMTSYRSAPAITALFAGLLDERERMQVESIQREEEAPHVAAYEDAGEYARALRTVIERAAGEPGLTAVIVPWKHEAKKLCAYLEGLRDDAPQPDDGSASLDGGEFGSAGFVMPQFIDDKGSLPESGVIITTLPLAKGLEFDHVIIPNAIERIFPDVPLARRQLYTTISRATRKIDILAHGALTPLLLAGRYNDCDCQV